MRGQYFNRGIDFAISLNKIPVCFKDDDNVTINLVDGCMILVWLNYISYLKGHPLPDANSCQLILKYMLLNRQAFVKSFHDRMYYYSSGTKFCEVSTALTCWMTCQDKLHDDYLANPVRPYPPAHSPIHPLTRAEVLPHIHCLTVYLCMCGRSPTRLACLLQRSMRSKSS